MGSLAAGPNAPEDSDEWLEVDPDELDAMLLRSAGGRQATAGGPMQMTEEHGKALQDLAAKVQDFVGGEGDMEGARFAEYVCSEVRLTTVNSLMRRWIRTLTQAMRR